MDSLINIGLKFFVSILFLFALLLAFAKGWKYQADQYEKARKKQLRSSAKRVNFINNGLSS